jgi:prepilin-type N-terminal cleavage/methylation domain-containing protein
MKESRMRARAFTLIELLVCVAVIALLIAILVPSLAAAKARAKDSVCGSNLRQLATAAVMYAHDWDAYVGYAPGIDRKMLLYPYLSQGKNNADVAGSQAWNCPMNQHPDVECGYGFNTNLNWLKLTQVANWSTTVAVCDSGIRDTGVQTLSTMCNPPSAMTVGTNYAYRPNPRHGSATRGKVEAAFVDGHAEPLEMTAPFYPGPWNAWAGNGVTDVSDPAYKDQLWDLQ